MAELRVGVLSCSDSRACGEAEDLGGRRIVELCEERGWLAVAYHVCPDDPESICTSLLEMCDLDEVDVAFTIGGTALGPRDVTPESTKRVCERMVPGLAEMIRARTVTSEPDLMLSRATAGVRGHTLIVNLPGGDEHAVDAFYVVADQLERASEMLHTPWTPGNETDVPYEVPAEER